MSRARTALLLAAIILISLNLRPAIIAVAPLLDEIREQTGMSSTLGSLLTTLPVFCFGALAPLGPRLARRFGNEPVVAGALVLLALGILIRLVPGMALLLAGTVVIGGAIAVMNVVMPSVIKRDLPHLAGPAMGIYAMMLTVGAALAAGFVIPLKDAVDTDWRGALALWSGLALIALMVWMPVLRFARSRPDGGPVAPRAGGLLRDRTAWFVTLFMGFQTLQFYTAAAWLPTIFVDGGMSEHRAGLMLSLLAVVGAASALAVPVVAARISRQSHLATATAGLWLIAWIGMLTLPQSGAVVWMLLGGIAQGAGIGLALTLMVLRAPDAEHTVELSGMAQTFGYLIGAVGPLAVGALHDLTGGWTAPMVVLVLLLVPMAITGIVAGRPGFVQGRARSTPAPTGE